MKSLQALLRGYILFRVNGAHFLAYGAGRRRKDALAAFDDGALQFDGLHVFKGWTGFWCRFT